MEAPGSLLFTRTLGLKGVAEPSTSSTPLVGAPLTSATGYGVTSRGMDHGRREEGDRRLLVSDGETSTLQKCDSRLVSSEHALSPLSAPYRMNRLRETPTRREHLTIARSNTYQMKTNRSKNCM